MLGACSVTFVSLAESPWASRAGGAGLASLLSGMMVGDVLLGVSSLRSLRLTIQIIDLCTIR